MSWSDDARCLYCGAKLSLHRKVLAEQFCSDAHLRSFRIDQDQLALERLSANHQQLNPQLTAELQAFEPYPSFDELSCDETPCDETALDRPVPDETNTALESQPEIPSTGDPFGSGSLNALAGHVYAEAGPATGQATDLRSGDVAGDENGDDAGISNFSRDDTGRHSAGPARPAGHEYEDRRVAHEYPARSLDHESPHHESLHRESLESLNRVSPHRESLASRPFAFTPGQPLSAPVSALESAIAVAQIADQTTYESVSGIRLGAADVLEDRAREDRPLEAQLVDSADVNVGAHLAILGQAIIADQRAYQPAEHAIEDYDLELGPYFVEAFGAAAGPACSAVNLAIKPIESNGYELAVPETLAVLTIASERVGLVFARQGASAECGSHPASIFSPLAAYLPELSLPADAHALLISDFDAAFPDWAIVMPLFSGLPGVFQAGTFQNDGAGSGLVLASPSKYLMASAPRNTLTPGNPVTPGNPLKGSGGTGNAPGTIVARNINALPLSGLAQTLALPRLAPGLPTALDAGQARLLSLRVRLTAADAVAGSPGLAQLGVAPEFAERFPMLPASRLTAVWRGSDQGRVKNAFTFWSGGTPDQAGHKHALATATDFWHNAPREFKLLAVAIPLLLALVFHPGLPKISFSTRGTKNVLAKAPAKEAALDGDATQAVSAASSFSSSLPSTSAPNASASPRFVAAKSTTPADVGFALNQTEKPSENGFSANLRDHFAVFEQNLAERAGVELNDDFRSGMDAWQSRGDLAAGWSFDSNGFVRPGTMALYHPSLPLRDYDMEFLGLIDKKALSWMVRAQDFDNYYAVKLVVIKAEPLPRLGIRRYAVINGKPQKAVEIPFPNPTRADTMYRVGMTIHDDTFLLTLQGKVVDTWSEPRLKRGGIGFFSSPGEESRLRWVHVSHQYDMLGRICAFLAPYNTAYNAAP